MAGFHQKWRYNIRLAGRKGVTVKEGTREDLKDFHKIMVETGKRDGFITRPLEYFEKTQEIYLVQSFDILTIQPLTAFLRDLKTKGILARDTVVSSAGEQQGNLIKIVIEGDLP